MITTIYSFGLSAKMLAQMTDDETSRLCQEVENYRRRHGANLELRIEKGTIAWYGDFRRMAMKQVASFLTGYLISMGFDESEVRHSYFNHCSICGSARIRLDSDPIPQFPHPHNHS